MNKGELSNWFERVFIQFQVVNGRSSLDRFAEHIGISRGYLSQLLNGTRTTVSRNTAVAICEKLSEYTLLDILGYARPEPKPVPFSSLPPEFVELLKTIDLEIEKTLRERSITEYSPEAEAVAFSILEKSLALHPPHHCIIEVIFYFATLLSVLPGVN